MKGPEILILDGGLGTTLEDEHGWKFDSKTTPLWSSHLLFSDDGRQVLKECQKNFRAAGADILLTGTYQVSEEGIARTPLLPALRGVGEEPKPKDSTKDDVTAALERGIDSTLQAWYEKPNLTCASHDVGGVALSLGPYGACMVPGQEYSGNYDAAHKTEDALFEWHLRRLALFTTDEAESKPLSRLQFIAFETIPVLAEIRAVRRAIKASALEAKPFWISCVFPNDDARLPDGSSVRTVVKAMLEGDEARPFGIGFNCVKLHKVSRLINLFESSISELISEEKISKPPTLVIYPDGTNGEVYDTVTQTWQKNEQTQSTVSWEDQFASVVTASSKKGIFSHFIVGGCCKARPADIQRLRARLLDQQQPLDA